MSIVNGKLMVKLEPTSHDRGWLRSRVLSLIKRLWQRLESSKHCLYNPGDLRAQQSLQRPYLNGSNGSSMHSDVC